MEESSRTCIMHERKYLDIQILKKAQSNKPRLSDTKPAKIGDRLSKRDQRHVGSAYGAGDSIPHRDTRLWRQQRQMNWGYLCRTPSCTLLSASPEPQSEGRNTLASDGSERSARCFYLVLARRTLAGPSFATCLGQTHNPKVYQILFIASLKLTSNLRSMWQARSNFAVSVWPERPISYVAAYSSNWVGTKPYPIIVLLRRTARLSNIFCQIPSNISKSHSPAVISTNSNKFLSFPS